MRGHFRVRGISAEEAADMAQEAAIRAYVHVRRRGMNGETLFPLMNQIARNMLIDRHRRSGPQMVALDECEEPTMDASHDPTEVVVSLEAQRAVRDAVAGLPDRHRDVILLALQGMTPAEVAEKMGIGRNAADALLHRARRSLKDRLRVVGESALGLVGLSYIRLRGEARRAQNIGAFANTGMFGALQGTVSAVAAAMIVAIGFGSPFAQAVTPSTAVRDIASSAVGASVVGSDSSLRGSTTPGSTSKTYLNYVAHVGSEGNPVDPGGTGSFHARLPAPSDPHQTIAGIDYEVWKPDQHSGQTGSQEDTASQAMCGNAARACDVIRKGLG